MLQCISWIVAAVLPVNSLPWFWLFLKNNLRKYNPELKIDRQFSKCRSSRSLSYKVTTQPEYIILSLFLITMFTIYRKVFTIRTLISRLLLLFVPTQFSATVWSTVVKFKYALICISFASADEEKQLSMKYIVRNIYSDWDPLSLGIIYPIYFPKKSVFHPNFIYNKTRFHAQRCRAECSPSCWRADVYRKFEKFIHVYGMFIHCLDITLIKPNNVSSLTCQICMNWLIKKNHGAIQRRTHYYYLY